MFRDDADISILFLLGNGIQYLEPVDDEWYHTSPATVEVSQIQDNKSYSIHTYLPSESAAPLGCADQYQFCQTKVNHDKQCGPLASLRDAISGIAPLFDSIYESLADNNATTAQQALFLYFSNIVFAAPRHTGDIIKQLRTKALQSRKTLFEGVQKSLPSNQWQLDVKHWFDISNAAMQAAFISTAHGPSNQDILQSYTSFAMPLLDQLCKNQVFHLLKFCRIITMLYWMFP